MTTVSITRTNDKLITETPYNKSYIKAVKEIDGQWDPIRSAWIVSLDKEQELMGILERVYGWTEDKADKTLRIRFDARVFEVAQGDILLDNIRVALRWTRNEDVTMCNGAKIVEGTFGNDGKSTTRPRVVGSETTDEVIVEMEISQSDYDNLRDDTKEFVEIVSDDEDTEDDAEDAEDSEGNNMEGDTEETEEIKSIADNLRSWRWNNGQHNVWAINIAPDGETPMYRGCITNVYLNNSLDDLAILKKYPYFEVTTLNVEEYCNKNGTLNIEPVMRLCDVTPGELHCRRDALNEWKFTYDVLLYVTEPTASKEQAMSRAYAVVRAYRRDTKEEMRDVAKKIQHMGLARPSDIRRISREFMRLKGRY